MLSQEELRIALESVSTKKLTNLLDRHKIYILEPKITKLDIIDTIILLRQEEIPEKEIMNLIKNKKTRHNRHKKRTQKRKQTKKSKRKR